PRMLYLTPFTTEEQWEAWGEEFRLDRPLPVQYLVWLGKFVRGDMGTSLREGRPVLTIILKRLPASLQLGLAAFVFSAVIGVVLGVVAAVRRASMMDYVGRTFALLGQALPPFWVGIVLILIFSVRLHWLPTSGRGGVTHFIMPAVTLGWLAAAANLRLVRSAMLATLDSEYVKLARAKGVHEWVVIWKHALRNALIPPLTQMGLTLASFIGGAVVTESVFSWPGVGRLALDAVYNNDYPLLIGVVLLISMLYLVVNLLTDIAYGYIDPRIRYS
ncbi:MAG: ABC transporter permease, partial [Chloroflexota bacterium]|nr:ABC transporter permease [Chloroflexota bacterium]